VKRFPPLYAPQNERIYFVHEPNVILICAYAYEVFASLNNTATLYALGKWSSRAIFIKYINFLSPQRQVFIN
jgi:hypothetical protein